MQLNYQCTPTRWDEQGSIYYPVVRDPTGWMRPATNGEPNQEGLQPVRKIPPKRKSLSGYVPFYGVKRNVWFESSLERSVLEIFKALDGKFGVLEQPVRLNRKSLGFGRGPYTPDFLFWEFTDGRAPSRVTLVEVKYESDLRENWARIHPKLLSGKRFAQRQGWRFLLLTERHLRVPCSTENIWPRRPHALFTLTKPESLLLRLFGPSVFEVPK